LRGRKPDEVLPAVKAWAAGLDTADPKHGRNLLEALWVTWGLGRVDRDLLDEALGHPQHQVRAGAVRVLRHSYWKVSDAPALLLRAAADGHPRVRLEAVAAASWMDNLEGGQIFAEALKRPVERWLGAPYQAAMWTLEDELREAVQRGLVKPEEHPRLAGILSGKIVLEPTIKEPKQEMTNVPAKALRLYEIGREVYHRDAHCVTCHQANGQGLPNIYPSLEKNEWVSGDETRLIKMVLKGLWGPIEVAGQKFDPTKGVPPMTGFEHLLTDEEIAGVLTFVRYSFKNSYPMISPDAVKRVREESKGRQGFYMVEELLKEHPFPQP
jgi:mono/diheme cytochrome c family protein